MFKDWLVQEETHKNNIIKLDVFDFDDTLVHTPDMKKGKDLLQKYNIQAAIEEKPLIKPIDRYSYYYAYQSLEPPVIPEPCPCGMLNQKVAQQFYTSARNSQVYTVILTGRPPHLEKHLRRILGDFKMNPNRLVMVPVSSGTLPKKIEILAGLLDEFPSIEDLEMWDDRGPLKAKFMDMPDENHIGEFRKFVTTFNSFRDTPIKFKINEIPPRNVTAAQLYQKYAAKVEKEQKDREAKEKEKNKKKPDKKSAAKKTAKKKPAKKKSGSKK